MEELRDTGNCESCDIVGSMDGEIWGIWAEVFNDCIWWLVEATAGAVVGNRMWPWRVLEDGTELSAVWLTRGSL